MDHEADGYVLRKKTGLSRESKRRSNQRSRQREVHRVMPRLHYFMDRDEETGDIVGSRVSYAVQPMSSKVGGVSSPTKKEKVYFRKSLEVFQLVPAGLTFPLRRLPPSLPLSALSSRHRFSLVVLQERHTNIANVEDLYLFPPTAPPTSQQLLRIDVAHTDATTDTDGNTDVVGANNNNANTSLLSLSWYDVEDLVERVSEYLPIMSN